MSTSQSFGPIRLSGTQVHTFTNSQPGDTNALVTIDRTVNGGLNSLTSADTLQISVDRSLDGVNWTNVAGITCVGGVIVTKGVTLSQEQIAIGLDAVGEAFRFTTIASTAVKVAGTVVYS